MSGYKKLEEKDLYIGQVVYRFNHKNVLQDIGTIIRIKENKQWYRVKWIKFINRNRFWHPLVPIFSYIRILK